MDQRRWPHDESRAVCDRSPRPLDAPATIRPAERRCQKSLKRSTAQGEARSAVSLVRRALVLAGVLVAGSSLWASVQGASPSVSVTAKGGLLSADSSGAALG